jgi:hypothetical protein
VAAHLFANMTNGNEQHPLTGWMMQIANQVAADAGSPMPPMQAPDFDELFGLLNRKRDALLAILRSCIALNEPLRCSL